MGCSVSTMSDKYLIGSRSLIQSRILNDVADESVRSMIVAVVVFSRILIDWPGLSANVI